MPIKSLIKAFFPVNAIRRQKSKRRFENTFIANAAKLADARFSCRWEDRWPCLDDATTTTGFDAHYIYHPAWAARKLAENFNKLHTHDEVRHIDISSSLHFVTMISAFIPVDFYDYRPVSLKLSGINCKQCDITNLPFPSASVLSLSCMHVVEHIGLQRYGDPFDPQGDIKAIRELERVLAPHGKLYFVAPVGNEARIQYNAHRIYTYSQIMSFFCNLSLVNFAFVDDTGKFFDKATQVDTVNSRYGCGCFEFLKNTP